MIETFNYNKTQKDLEIAVKRIKDARTNLAFAREMWIKDISMRTNFLRLLILKRRKELEEALKSPLEELEELEELEQIQ